MNFDINYNLYKTFYIVGSSNSIKEAALKMYVSQPAISKQIKQLENVLGVKLLYRYNKGIELTEEGKALYEQIERVNYYVDTSIKQISKFKQMTGGKIDIGCQSHIAGFFLMDKLEKFRKDYPNIKISIISDSTSTLIDELIHHKIDFMIDFLPIDIIYKNITIEKLKSYDTVFIANKNFETSKIKLDKLGNVSFVLPPLKSSIRKRLFKSLTAQELTIEPLVEVDTTDLIIKSVKNSLGVGYVIKEAAIEEINNKQVKVLKLPIDLPTIDLGLIYIDDCLTHQATVFIDSYIRNNKKT